MLEQAMRAYTASLDPTTGLYDGETIRRRIAEELSRARRYHYPLSLIVAIFSTPEAWHAEDRVQQLAQLLERHVRTTDILARLNHSGLVALLPHTGEAGARCLGERVYQLATVMQLPAGLGGNPAPVHVGVTTVPADYGEDAAKLVDTLWERLRTEAGGRRAHFAFITLS
jgi:two-component system cell cycle response regulator